MSSISEIYRVRQRAIEYAIKHNNNSKAAVKYKTSRQHGETDTTAQSSLFCQKAEDLKAIQTSTCKKK